MNNPKEPALDDKQRKPDTNLRVDNEKDSLYDDGLDVEDDSEKLIDTRDSRNPE